MWIEMKSTARLWLAIAVRSSSGRTRSSSRVRTTVTPRSRQQAVQPHRKVEGQRFFLKSGRADGAGFDAAVAGIEDDHRERLRGRGGRARLARPRAL
jgi:hypothetical protein